MSINQSINQYLRHSFTFYHIQTQSLALRALRKRKPQETQALAISRNKRKRQPIGMLGQTMIGCLPTQALAFLAVFVYATHAMQAIAFEWKPAYRLCTRIRCVPSGKYVIL